jgi:hypothetical protein
MRAWPRHNLVSAIPFDPTGHADHGGYFMDLGGAFGLTTRQVRRCLQQAIEATSTYDEQVMALERVPLQQRRQLVEIVQRERGLLQTQLR